MIMNKLVIPLIAALIALGPAPGLAQGKIENDSAYLAIEQAIDLTAIHPEVNVNLPRFLLQDALSEFNGGPDDPFVSAGIDLADLVKDVKLIRVVVIEPNKTNSAALAKGIAALRTTLETKWTPIVSVPEDGVGIFAIGDPEGETIAGLALLIHENDDEAVIANIVGRVSLGKLVKVASRMKQFPKDLLKNLAEAGNSQNAESKPVKSAKPAK
jgi:hypothetical protein